MIKKLFGNKKIWIPLLAVLVLGGGFFIYQTVINAQNTMNSMYQTTPLERGSLTATVGATGTVRAKQTALINWQVNGTVGSVMFEVGDKVKSGDRLAELSLSSLPQSIILAQADLITAERNLENLEKSNLSTSQAEQALALAQKALDKAKDNMESKKFTKADQSTIDSAFANYVLAKEELAKYEDDFFGTQYMEEDNPTRASAVSLYSAALQRMDTAYANYNYAKSYPDELEQAEIQANYALAQAKVNDAQREYDRLKDGADPEDIAAARARVAAIEASIKLAYLETPFGGTVTTANAKEGDQVSPATPGFRIDDLSHFYADIQLTEVDINRIEVGQDAVLTFDAIPGKEYKAKVTEVGKVGTTVAGVVNFVVTIEIIEPDDNVKPGMTAAVTIVVNQMDDILVIPNRAVRLQEGDRVVYILKDNIPTPVKVVIGASSDINSELIESELKEGDLIILNPPSQESFGPPQRGGGPN